MGDSLLKISYNMTLEEIEAGFRLFQKKYQLKRSILFTIVYGIALVLGVDFIIRDRTNFYGYILAGLAIGLIFWQWYRPVYIRKKMINTISSLAQEDYVSEFFQDRLEITTMILEEKSSEKSGQVAVADNADEEKSAEVSTDVSDNVENEEIQSDNTDDTVVTVLNFGTELMDALENEEMFLLFVNKSLIYIYPKRCLEETEQETLRNILKDKAILA